MAGERLIDVIGDDHSEDCIAKEFEPFVRDVTGVFGAPAAVAQGALQQGGVTESVSEPLGEDRERVRAGQLPLSRPNT